MSESKIIVAMVEKAEGNESIGTAWIETALFRADQDLSEVLAWAEGVTFAADGNVRGKLMLRRAQDMRGSNA